MILGNHLLIEIGELCRKPTPVHRKRESKTLVGRGSSALFATFRVPCGPLGFALGWLWVGLGLLWVGFGSVRVFQLPSAPNTPIRVIRNT